MKLPKDIFDRLHISKDWDVLPCPFCHKIPVPSNAKESNGDYWYCHCLNEDDHDELNDSRFDDGFGAYGEYTRDAAVVVWNAAVTEYEEDNATRNR